MGTPHSVRRGECISSLGFRYGFYPETIWEHADNRALRDERSDPNTLKEGDTVSIPDKREKTVSCATTRRHEFRRRGVPEKLKIRFLLNGEPRANEPFELEIDGVLTSGKTTADGRIDPWIDPAAKSGKIRFPESGAEYELQLGHLEPVEVLTGVQARLANLGFYFGPIDGELNEATKGAIKAFQVNQGIEPGDLDDRTRDALAKAYRQGARKAT